MQLSSWMYQFGGVLRLFGSSGGTYRAVQDDPETAPRPPVFSARGDWTLTGDSPMNEYGDGWHALPEKWKGKCCWGNADLLWNIPRDPCDEGAAMFYCRGRNPGGRHCGDSIFRHAWRLCRVHYAMYLLRT